MASVSPTTIYTAEELLARARAGTSGTDGSDSSGILSANELLSRASKRERGEVVQDKVELSDPANSAVQKLVRQQEEAKKKLESKGDYTEQEWYINARVAQLKGQIQIYANLPGLDPSGAVMDALAKEVNELVSGQREKLLEANKKAKEAQDELDRQKAEATAKGPTPEELLRNVKNKLSGAAPSPVITKEVQALLEKSKGALLNQTA